MSENKINFSSNNMDEYLKELAKEYRKRSGKNIPAEITLVGGAAILANYGFLQTHNISEETDEPTNKYN